MSQQQSVSVNEPETGDDGAIHDFWALSREQIQALAALSDEDKRVLWEMTR